MATKFETSIWLREGPFMMRRVDSVDEALAFLEHWHGDRGAVFHFTLSTLRRTLGDDIDVDEARASFWRFADDAGILGESAAA
jgi:hypothetical protein